MKNVESFGVQNQEILKLKRLKLNGWNLVGQNQIIMKFECQNCI
jgi:hypothetical protein